MTDNILKFPHVDKNWSATDVLKQLLEWAERGDLDKLLVVYARTEGDQTLMQWAASKMDMRDKLMLAAFAEHRARQKLFGAE